MSAASIVTVRCQLLVDESSIVLRYVADDMVGHEGFKLLAKSPDIRRSQRSSDVSSSVDCDGEVLLGDHVADFGAAILPTCAIAAGSSDVT